MKDNQLGDRFGLGWRQELALDIFAHLERIDVVEVIADDFFTASARTRRSLRTLAAQTPVILHGVSLGLASCVPVEPKRLEQMARLVSEIEPDFWSEHLAFVRGGGIEVGHLSAPPRTAATIEGAATNLRRARQVVGAAPLVENIATLIDPPGSDCDELAWINTISQTADCDLLFDLHNLHANATNFGYDPRAFIAQLPAERITAVHLAGGKWVSALGEQRVLDDHLHDVPAPVYDLLEVVGAHVSQPLTVILERDGEYPPIEILLGQLDRARAALAAGRARRARMLAQEAA
jgi:uncharacterized protein